MRQWLPRRVREGLRMWKKQGFQVRLKVLGRRVGRRRLAWGDRLSRSSVHVDGKKGWERQNGPGEKRLLEKMALDSQLDTDVNVDEDGLTAKCTLNHDGGVRADLGVSAVGLS
jgi:hypothetical protein